MRVGEVVTVEGSGVWSHPARHEDVFFFDVLTRLIIVDEFVVELAHEAHVTLAFVLPDGRIGFESEEWLLRWARV